MTVDLKDVTVLISPHKTAHFQLFVTGRYQGIKVTHIARSHLKWMRVGILGKDRADNRDTQHSRGFHPGSRLFIRENQRSVPHGRDSLRKLPSGTRGAQTKMGKTTWVIGQVERRELCGQTSCAGVHVPGWSAEVT